MNDTSASDREPSDDVPGETPETDATRRSPALIATAIALPVALLVGVVVAAVTVSRSPVNTPVGLGPVPAPEAESESCAQLLAALPEKLGDYTRAELADPAPVGAAAWQSDEGDEVVLRCGLDRPDEFDQAAALQVIDEVQWFEVSGAEQGIPASTWFTVDRPVYVALTVPDGSGPTPLQDITAAIEATLPQQQIDPAPIR
ncbi:membrane protein [Rhodococcus gordoniae]|uniref:Membrane protein n=1 Tax=Rhodococcus gordoniae TaxID=223392 RepID=A0A379LU58_9NOCA|nr:membrane protein [Rhodococcus gordoniae]